MVDFSAAVARFETLLGQLDEAFKFCRSLGLTPERGRFGQYQTDVASLADLARAGGAESLSPDDREAMQQSATRHRVALWEGRELVAMLPYLACAPRGQVAPKLAAMLTGPALPVDEDADSNYARNIQFELLLASTLSRAGYMPVLGEHPDVRIEPNGRAILFECKRVFSPAKVSVRIRDAGEQLRRDLKHHPSSSLGVVVVSLSPLLNPTGDAFQMPNRERGQWALGEWLDRAARAAQADYQELFRRSLAVAAFFFADSDFFNLETGAYEHGTHFVVDQFVPPSASYRPTLELLQQRLEAQTRVDAS